MAERTEDQDERPTRSAPRFGLGWRLFGALLLLALVALAYAWVNREQLADRLITDQLEELGLEASYTIESISPNSQVLTDIVIGNPADPDLTIDRAEISLEPRLPFIGIGKLTLVRPRFFGSYRDGKLSFGSLDPLLFEGESDAPFSFPDLVLDLQDARGFVDSDYGPVGIKAAGYGNLQGGFDGILAAVAPDFAVEGCRGQGASLYGKVSVDAERPAFAGPLRLGALDCPAQELTLSDAALDLSMQMDRNLKGLEGKASLAGGALALTGNRLGSLGGSATFAWRDQGLTAQYDLAAVGLETPQLNLGSLDLEGSVRSRSGFDEVEIQLDVKGESLRPGVDVDAALAQAAEAASDTLAGPMLSRIRSALTREGPSSTLSASLTLRQEGAKRSLVMPQAQIKGGSGDVLLALSRFQLSSTGEETPRFSGNFLTGGRGLPRISGRMEHDGERSDTVLQLRMADYAVEDGRLAIPRMVVSQTPGGGLSFSGAVEANGAIPGGDVRGLSLPISGGWSASRGLEMWRGCVTAAFDKLTLSSLALDKRALRLCGPTGGAIVRSNAQGMHISAGVPSLDLTGTLAETPIAVRSGAVGLAWPGTMTARDVEVVLGNDGDSDIRFTLSEVVAAFTDTIRGQFSDVTMRMAAVPLDVLNAEGDWSYEDEQLVLSNAALRIEDRQKPGRFEPLIARDATLTLADSRITADALLREPASDRKVVATHIVHDLTSGTGQANLDVESLIFDDRVQPDTLTGLALGVVANARGVVTGDGVINWNADEVTSSGRFSTEGIDFAAAFGPVQGVSGTIEFTDLLGMVTAPDQRLQIRSFNPGIQVDQGDLVYELRDNFLLVVKGGEWPFIGGKLILEPTQTRMTEAEVRRYTLRLERVDAAQFVEQMELANIAASGTFDGTVPLVFDENGGRIDGGHLKSREPGGNVSYVGGLTYEDINPIANFAFDALKSLDYRVMEIDLSGSLTGEVVTKVRFDGIRQGEGASSNFVTKQLAKLPLQFNLNIRAPFYRLISEFKGMYDPAFVRDPRSLNLIDEKGRPVEKPVLTLPDGVKPEDLPQDESVIQPLESENVE